MKVQTTRVTVPSLLERKSNRAGQGAKICALTAYDFSMARLIDRAGIDIILIGDSLGTVIQGLETTIPVTLDEVIYHSRCVSRAVERALVVADMPFMTYQTSPEKALEAAGRLLKESGAAAVKLEGGLPMRDTIRRIVDVDIPVMGHVGLTPQSYHRMGGHRQQGRGHSNKDRPDAGSRERIMADARAVEEAGAFAVVLEGIPSDLAAEITAALQIPTIGIGAGPGCDGQILVVHDMLGMDSEFSPSFVKKYADLASVITGAAQQYIEEVQSSAFPAEAAAGKRLARCSA